MTRSILVLGNSHVAALRRGWLEISGEFPDTKLQFFAANSKLFNLMELSEDRVFGALSATSRGWQASTRMLGVSLINRLVRGLGRGRNEGKQRRYSDHQLKFLDQVCRRRAVNLKRFDHVVLAGRNANEADFLRQFEPFSIDGVRERPGCPSLSQPAFESFCREIAMKRLVEPEWRNWDHPRLAFLPAPTPRADCPGDDPRYEVWARYGANPATGLDFLKTYRAQVEALYREHGVTLLSPPDEVYDESGLTRVEFGEDPMRLHPRGGTFGQSDFHHMNTEYGKIVLRHVLQQLA